MPTRLAWVSTHNARPSVIVLAPSLRRTRYR
ncbi:hypothetical protein OpiT1DRAFT_02466 [Opitutaceae bacterium TAV1]|nr:hypothetical protein OpiT1DRAFT_02466 [Opitutaceae bacterium TAV1]